MKPPRKNGFTITEFLITIVSLFSGLYFIFWSCYLGSNYTLAQYYLNDFSFCELNKESKSCWIDLKRKVDSLKFVAVQNLYAQKSAQAKTVFLVFNYELPIVGLNKGISGIKLSSVRQLGQWQ